MTVRFTAGPATHVGRLRAANQDAVAVQGDAFVVADGMGGHRGGEVAAQMAVQTFLASIEEPTTPAVVEAVSRANEAILARASEDPALEGMGTTLCALVAVDTDEGEKMCAVNVGDSRIYLFADGELQQISEDHSLVADFVRQGRLSAEDAENHPQRNILTRALGVDPDVAVDAWEIVPVAGDRFLLCSDGLFNEVSDGQIAAVLRRLADPTEAAHELVRLANEAGGRDNITVLVVDVAEGDDGAALPVTERVSRAHVDDLAGFTTAERPDAEPAEETHRLSSDPQEAEARRRTSGFRATLGRPRLTWRMGLFLLVVLAVVGVGVAAAVSYNRSGYYVGVDDDRVVIFHGRDGGFLWIQPTVEERTEIRVGQLDAADLRAVTDGVEVDSLGDAQAWIGELRERVRSGGASTTTTSTTSSTSSTSTTRPSTSTTAGTAGQGTSSAP